MPISEEICRAEQKHMSFFGTLIDRRCFPENSKAQKHMEIDAIWIYFLENTLGDGPAF